MASGSQNMTTYLAKGLEKVLTTNAINTDSLLYINTTDTNITADMLGTTTSIAFTRMSTTGAYTTGHIVWLNAADIGTPFQLVVHDSSDLYLYKRWKSSGAWTEWTKMRAGTADTWTTARTLTIGNTGKSVDGSANVSWSKDEILGASTNAYFLRGDKEWSNTLNGVFTANGNITANDGMLKSTANGNTVTIGSQNATATHIYNSANIPFYFNRTTLIDGDLGNTSYPVKNIYMGTANGTAIYYKSSKATYSMIRFIDNASNGDGNGISIGGGGQTIIGGGESASTAAAQVGTAGSEVMYVCNDENVDIISNLQNGWTNRKVMTLNTSGYLMLPSYINVPTSNSENPTVSQFIVTNGSDNYYRKASTAHAMAAIRGSASGSWGISITGNAATATVWQTARTLTIGNRGQSVNGSANVSWTLNDILYNATTIGTSTSWDQAGPSVYYVASSAAFTGTNHPGNNSEIMPYTYGQLIVSRAGGGGVLQIYAPHTGSSGAVNAGLRYRTGWNSAGWQTWSTLLDDRLWRKYIFCNKNINRSQLTVSDSTWNIIPSGAIDIFGLSFKDTALSDDTGDIRMWLQGKTTLHIQIDGAFHASEGFVGNASTATRINGNLAAATTDVNRNIWVSSTANADGIPNYISGFNINPSTKVFTVPAGTRISPSAGDLYLGNSGNQKWVYIQDMCSQDGQKWKIHQNGNAEFTGTVTAPTFSGNAATATKLLDSAHSWTATEVYNYMTARVLKAGDTMSGALTVSSTGNNRATVYIRSAGDVPMDLYLGSKNTNYWSISCRESANPYLGFYWAGSSGGWALLMHTNKHVEIPVHAYVGGYNNTSYALSTNSFICNSWVRTKGSTGWYNEDYGGGWYMSDAKWIRSYNSKPTILDIGTNNSYGIGGHRLALAMVGSSHVSWIMKGGSVIYGFCVNGNGNWYFGRRTNDQSLESSANDAYGYYGDNVSILPSSDNAKNLGSSGARWKTCYAVNFYGYLNGNISGSSTSCTGNAKTATTAASCSGNAATASKVGETNSWLYFNHSNEVNFGGANTSGDIYFGYRAIDSRPKPTNFIFGTGNGTATVKAATFIGALTGNVTGNCSGSSGSCTGNAATATKATQDGDGNTIKSTYLKLSGGVMTGQIEFNNKGSCRIFNSGNDAANGVGGALNNLVISSWYGVSFTTDCANVTYTKTNAVSINCRTGNVYAARFNGPLTGNVTGNCSGSAAKLGTANKGDANHPIYLSGGTPTQCSYPHSGAWFSSVPYIHSDGMMEIGRYIDFHGTNTTTADHTIRLTCAESSARIDCNGIFAATGWSDLAEYRRTIEHEPGRAVIPTDCGVARRATGRLQPGARIVSDTYGFCLGESDDEQSPIALTGRVLAYPCRPISEYHAGDAVCSGPNGTVDLMTREEIQKYPDCIVGIVNEIPTYTIWNPKHTDDRQKVVFNENVEVRGRIWIDVK